METDAHGIPTPSAVYEIAGRRFEIGSRGFAEAIAYAHAAHQRPRCMCLAEGAEMYVARFGDSYIVKRMPDTGSHHAPDCPSYEPPAEFSGLGQVLGGAITEDPSTGETTLKLDFPLTKMPGRSQMTPAGIGSDSVGTDGTKLTLRGLLHYLWDQADLTRWHPSFAGKRTWTTVRRHLLQAADNKLACGYALHARLYVPEPFSIDQRDAINARRLAQWQHAVPAPDKPQPLMLLIGEVKAIVSARYGYKVIVKHMPDQAFVMDELLYRRLGRRFESELALWGGTENLHLMMIATFGISTTGPPTVIGLSLMPVSPQWLPIEDAFDKQLIEALVREGRAFVKGLRYNLDKSQILASATLVDSGCPAPQLFIASPSVERDSWYHTLQQVTTGPDVPVWLWQPLRDAMPPLPRRRTQPRGQHRSPATPT